MLSAMKVIGVYNANGGLAGELSYFFGHLIGRAECKLCDITHSPFAKKAEWKAMEKRLHDELGVEFVLVHRNERTDAQLAASDGREPCILIEDNSGGLSMILDWTDLKLAAGSVPAFERAIRAKLLMY
jgi:hypothetical protein